MAVLLAAPLNIALATMGIYAGQLVSIAAGLFAIGPIILKMLVGHPLHGFQIETRRPA